MGNKCSNCGAVVSDTAKFCPECGTKIERELKCANCGAVLAENAKFCMECGTKVGVVENIIPVKETVEETVEPMGVQDGNHYTTINKIPKELDLSKYVITVEYVMRKEPDTLAMIAEKVNNYNDEVVKEGYTAIELDASSFTLKGQYVPKSSELETSNVVKAFVKGFKEGWDDAGVLDNFMGLCKLCESISTSPFVELNEICKDETVNSPLIYVDEVLPFSNFDDKAPDGVIAASTEIDVTYHLDNNPIILDKIAKKVDKYNKRATKKGYFTIIFDAPERVFKGKYYPQLETPDMSYFKKVLIAGHNADLCGDFLKICKLCETIMLR